jgi:hypothetical protein
MLRPIATIAETVMQALRRRVPERAAGHCCHWPGCTLRVPEGSWACLAHWYALPPGMRRRIFETYRPARARPSVAYLQATREVHAWIEAQRQPPAARP